MPSDRTVSGRLTDNNMPGGCVSNERWHEKETFPKNEKDFIEIELIKCLVIVRVIVLYWLGRRSYRLPSLLTEKWHILKHDMLFFSINFTKHNLR